MSRYELSDGSVYSGEVKNRIPHGHGSKTWPDGTFYKGEFKNGKYTTGKLVRFGGDIYTGSFVNNQYDGNGVLVTAETNGVSVSYRGAFRAGKYHGMGKFTSSNGCFFEGSFVKHQIVNGKGIIKYDATRIFIGTFRDGLMHGHGTLSLPGGDMYIGDFVKGERTGKGEFRFKSGDVYIGDLVNGERTGKGEMRYTDGDMYIGDFMNGDQTGKGEYRFKSGNVYIGDFVNGDLTGKGEYRFNDGPRDVHTGDFVDGVCTGKITGPSGCVIDIIQGVPVVTRSVHSEHRIDAIGILTIADVNHCFLCCLTEPKDVTFGKCSGSGCLGLDVLYCSVECQRLDWPEHKFMCCVEEDDVKRCAACHQAEPVKETFGQCSGCLDALYCSVECQRADWKTHKLGCVKK